MIELYAAGSPNVLRVLIALEELGFAYKARLVDIFGGEQFESDFLLLNPNAKVPVIVDHDGPGHAPYTVFESAAILIYLAEKAGRLLPVETRARFDALQWLVAQVTTVGPMMGQLVHFTRYAPPQPNDYARNRYHTQAMRVFGVMDARLGQSAYLAGDDYSIADLALYPWTMNIAANLGPEAEFPHLFAWRGKVAERPAVGRAIATQMEVRSRSTPPDKADMATLARVFGFTKPE